MQDYGKFVMVLDTLYKIPSFVQFMEAILQENVNRHEALKVHDMIHYVHIPLNRLNVYAKALKQTVAGYDPAYPDYSDLLHISQKFKALEKSRASK
jgi:hypothetical protein